MARQREYIYIYIYIYIYVYIYNIIVIYVIYMYHFHFSHFVITPLRSPKNVYYSMESSQKFAQKDSINKKEIVVFGIRTV